MNSILNARSSMMFPINVRIIQKSPSGRLVKETVAKNMVLRDFGVYSYIRFLMGSFFNSSLNYDPKIYIPHYLAVGTNGQDDGGEVATTPPGTTTTTKFTDVSLYSEILTNSKVDRISLNRSTYIEDSATNNIKIQYEAYIPEDKYVNREISELALMTQESGWNAFARITLPNPIIKTIDTVIQVIWEIAVVSIESSSRFEPLDKTLLKESIDEAINILYTKTTDPTGEGKSTREDLYNAIAPSTKNSTGLYYLINDNNEISQNDINQKVTEIAAILKDFE